MQIDDIGAATSHDFKKKPKAYDSTASLFQEYAIFLKVITNYNYKTTYLKGMIM